MKKYIVSCAALLLFIGVKAQTQKTVPHEKRSVYGDSASLVRLESDRKKIRDSAEYIFEGNIKSVDWYHRTYDCDVIETSIIITITKVFRGNLKLGTVELVVDPDPNGSDSGEKRYVESRTHIKQGEDTTHIFFCKKNKHSPYNAAYNIYPVDNKTILESYNRYYPSISLLHQKGLGCSESKNCFASLGAIYRYIGSFPKVRMPAITQQDTVRTRFHPNEIEKPSAPATISKAKRDSLNAIRLVRLKHESDSISAFRLKQFRYEQDSIANFKNKK